MCLLFRTKFDMNAIELLPHLHYLLLRQLLIIVNKTKQILLEIKICGVVVDANVITPLS